MDDVLPQEIETATETESAVTAATTVPLDAMTEMEAAPKQEHVSLDGEIQPDVYKRQEYKEGKVGNDSILIHQLCSDIEMLSAKHRNKKNKNRRNGRESRNVDQDGFVIPKIIPEWK